MLISPLKRVSHSPNLDPELNPFVRVLGWLFHCHLLILTGEFYPTISWLQTCIHKQRFAELYKNGGASILWVRGLTSYVKHTLLLRDFSLSPGVPHQVKHSTFPYSLHSFEWIHFFPYSSRRTDLISSSTLIPITSLLLCYCRTISIC